MRFAETSFRPPSGRAIAIVVSLMCLGGLAGFIATGDYAGLLRYSWAFLLVIAIGFALFWLPEVRVASSEVTVRNVFRTFHVPWEAIEKFDTKYSLTLTTSERTISAWASPAPNRYAASTAAPSDARIAGGAGRSGGGAIRPGDLPSTASGAAAFLIRRHLEDLREDGLLGDGLLGDGLLDDRAPTPPATIDTHWITIGVLTLLALATVLGIAL